jgi:hypothetical protein
MTNLEIVLLVSYVVFVIVVLIDTVRKDKQIKDLQFNVDAMKAKHTALDAHTCHELGHVQRKLKNLGQ